MTLIKKPQDLTINHKSSLDAWWRQQIVFLAYVLPTCILWLLSVSSLDPWWRQYGLSVSSLDAVKQQGGFQCALHVCRCRFSVCGVACVSVSVFSVCFILTILISVCRMSILYSTINLKQYLFGSVSLLLTTDMQLFMSCYSPLHTCVCVLIWWKNALLEDS